MAADRVRTPEVEALLRALLALETPDEAYAFLQDLCTIREIQDMAQRLDVARMLAAGEHYAHIQEVTGASATTISRVSKSLNYGADGYRACSTGSARPPHDGGRALARMSVRPPAHPLRVLAARRRRARRRTSSRARSSSRCPRSRSPTTAYMYGAVEFYQAGRRKAGVKPIIGCEVYFTPESRTQARGQARPVPPAAARQEQRGLPQPDGDGLATPRVNGFYYKPQVDLELLERYTRGSSARRRA